LEKTLLENEKQFVKFNLVVEASMIGIFEMTVVDGDPFGPESNVVYSEKLKSLLGFAIEHDLENTLNAFIERVHPDDRAKEIEALNRHFSDRTGKTPYNIELRLRKKKGDYAHFQMVCATCRDKNGVPLRVAGAIRDISEQKMYIEKIRHHEASLKKLLEAVTESEQKSIEKNHWYESLLDAFYESQLTATDVHKRITFLNKAALQTLGMTNREEAMGKYCGDVWDVEICKDERCGVECLKRGEGKSMFHIRDKTYTTFTSYIKDTKNETIGHIEVVSNITDAINRELETKQLYNLIYDSSEVIEMTAEGIIADMNEKAVRLFKNVGKEDFIGKSIEELIGKEAKEQVWNEIEQGKIYECVQQLSIADQTVSLNQKVIPMCNDSGILLKVVVMGFPMGR